MNEKIDIEEFKIKWKDFLASNSYGDLSKEIRNLLSRIKELEEGVEKIWAIVDRHYGMHDVQKIRDVRFICKELIGE